MRKNKNGNQVIQKTKRRKGKMLIGIIIVVGVIGLGLAGAIVFTAPGRREVQNLVIQDVDMSNLQDGTYNGSYIGKADHMRDTEVEVTIANGEIADVKIIKGALNSEGKPVELTGGKYITDLFADVAEKETLKVDTISGATLTSKTHLYALENALEQAVIK